MKRTGMKSMQGRKERPKGKISSLARELNCFGKKKERKSPGQLIKLSRERGGAADSKKEM